MGGDSQTLVDASANDSLSEQVALLLRQLQNYKRAPKGFLKSWQETQQADENSTARIFLNEGKFPAWFAYALLKNAAEVQYHFLGKADCNRLIVDLELESATSRKLLAARVAAAIEPELRNKVDSLHEKRIKPLRKDQMCQLSNKRRRTTTGSDCPPASSASIPSPAVTLSNASAHSASHEHAGERVLVSSDTSDYVAEDEHVLVNASPAAATALFPPYLAGAIRRTPYVQVRPLVIRMARFTFAQHLLFLGLLLAKPDLCYAVGDSRHLVDLIRRKEKEWYPRLGTDIHPALTQDNEANKKFWEELTVTLSSYSDVSFSARQLRDHLLYILSEIESISSPHVLSERRGKKIPAFGWKETVLLVGVSISVTTISWNIPDTLWDLSDSDLEDTMQWLNRSPLFAEGVAYKYDIDEVANALELIFREVDESDEDSQVQNMMKNQKAPAEGEEDLESKIVDLKPKIENLKSKIEDLKPKIEDLQPKIEGVTRDGSEEEMKAGSEAESEVGSESTSERNEDEEYQPGSEEDVEGEEEGDAESEEEGDAESEEEGDAESEEDDEAEGEHEETAKTLRVPQRLAGQKRPSSGDLRSSKRTREETES